MDKNHSICGRTARAYLDGSFQSKAQGLCVALILGVVLFGKLSTPLPAGANHAFTRQAWVGSEESLPEASKLKTRVTDLTFSPSPRRRPRILTILTTYEDNAAYIKAYKRGLKRRQDGYQPKVRRFSPGSVAKRLSSWIFWQGSMSEGMKGFSPG